MSLERGKSIGNYTIKEPIGKGGMGEVYRARDTRLARDVAIKVLPEELSRDKDRKERFEREARLLAQINHPNIATLHGLEEHEGQLFLVMELVEGETLAERIARGPIPEKQTVALFIQIAEGLQAAHDGGIIHRDLKPANIKITPDGKIKILDFGLAKTFSADDGVSADTSQSPTLTKGTALGVILGTAAYMSPEQARANPVDRRTDVWAFGCCLYEALTGTRAFQGEAMADVIGAVVHKEPDWSRLPAGGSLALSRLLRRCLKKDARERVHAIADARFELEDISLTPPPAEADNRSAGISLRLAVAGLSVALVLGAMAGVFWSSPSETAGNDILPRRLTKNPIENSVTSAALSADGRYLAYVDNNGLFVRLIETGETSRIETPDGFELSEVDWYPDGTSLLFTAITEDQHALWRISVLGGEPRLLVDRAWRASVSPDGFRIAYRTPSSAVYVAGPNGEDPEKLVTTSSWQHAWSPDV